MLADHSDTVPHWPTILHALADQVESNPNRVAVNAVRRQRGGAALVATPLTVGEIAAWATYAGEQLEAVGARAGDRVLLSLSEPRHFVGWAVGALLRGMIVVPVPAVSEMGAPAAFRERIAGVRDDCAPTVAIVENLERWAQVADAAALPVIQGDAIETASLEPKAFDISKLPRADQVAALQYTSGSTGRPRGVVLTHGNIVANCHASGAAAGFGPHDRMISWLPLHHDMGLVGGLLTMIYWEVETFVMTPLTFVGRPAYWLGAIHAFGGTLTVGPTFGYALCVERIPDEQIAGVDLSTLRLAFVGAEPVSARTARAFVDRFATYGLRSTAIYPVYGLAEATLAVSFPQPGAPLVVDRVNRGALAGGRADSAMPDDERCLEIVGLGTAVPRHTVRVVDAESGRECEEREVGEVRFAGASVSPRYWSDPDTARDELRTGDLGYIADGQLFLVDRLKDIVIVAGQNYATSDIESAVVDVPGVRRRKVAAFASHVASERAEALCLVAELDRSTWGETWHEPEEVARNIAAAVLMRTGLTTKVVHLAPAGSLQFTTSGKVQRSLCRRQFEAGVLPRIQSVADWQVARASEAAAR